MLDPAGVGALGRGRYGQREPSTAHNMQAHVFGGDGVKGTNVLGSRYVAASFFLICCLPWFYIGLGSLFGATSATVMSVATLLVVLLQALIAARQAAISKDQAYLMSGQLAAARVAADAAKASVDLTRTLTGAQQRAYVLIAGFRLVAYRHGPGPGPNDSWIPYVVLRNAGNTPAERITTGIHFYFGEQRNLPAGFLARDDLEKQYWPDIGSNGNQPVGFGGLPNSFWEDVKAGKSHYFLFGWVEYNDIFDSVKRRRTEFCYAIRPLGDLNGPDCAIATQVTDTHNSRDDQCMFKPKPWFPPGAEFSIRVTGSNGKPTWPRNAV